MIWIILGLVALFFLVFAVVVIFEVICELFKRLDEILEKVLMFLGVLVVLYTAYILLWPYVPGTAKWLWSCLAWIFDVVSGGLGWIFNVVSSGLSWMFNGVFGGVSWISNSLNFGAIYGSLGANSEFFSCIFIVAIVAFILCYNANKQNKWSCRCLCYIPVILLVAAPIVGNYANVPIFGITPVGVSTLGADVVASQVILLIWLLATALVLVAGMYIEKQRNELQAKIKAVDSALKKLCAEL